MLEQHEQLAKVRDAQLQGAQAELARRCTVRDGAAREVARIEAARLALATQRDAWDRQWQAWTRQGGALQRGKAYAEQHLKIAALEDDLAQDWAEAVERLLAAQGDVDVARAIARRRHDALAQIRDVVARLQKQRRQERDARDVQRTEDTVAARWYLARKAAMTGAAHE